MAYSAFINRSGLLERQYPYQRTAKASIEAGMAVATAAADGAGNTEIPLVAGTVVPVQWRFADVKQYDEITQDETDSYSYAIGDLLYSLDPMTNDLYNVYIDNPGAELVLTGDGSEILQLSGATDGAFIVAAATDPTTVVGTRPLIVAEAKTIAIASTGRVVARFVNV